MKGDPYYTHFIKMNQRLNIRLDSIVAFKKKVERSFLNIGFDNDFFEYDTKIMTEEIINDRTISNLKASSQKKRQSTKWKYKLQNGGKVLQITYWMRNWYQNYWCILPKVNSLKGSENFWELNRKVIVWRNSFSI